MACFEIGGFLAKIGLILPISDIKIGLHLATAIGIIKVFFVVVVFFLFFFFGGGSGNDLLYKPLFSRTVIFAFLDFCGNSRVVNFAIFLMLSLLYIDMNWSGNFREGLAREIRENKTLAKITAYTVFNYTPYIVIFCISKPTTDTHWNTEYLIHQVVFWAGVPLEPRVPRCAAPSYCSQKLNWVESFGVSLKEIIFLKICIFLVLIATKEVCKELIHMKSFWKFIINYTLFSNSLVRTRPALSRKILSLWMALASYFGAAFISTRPAPGPDQRVYERSSTWLRPKFLCTVKGHTIPGPHRRRGARGRSGPKPLNSMGRSTRVYGVFSYHGSYPLCGRVREWVIVKVARLCW